jgi:NADH:ubiquinone oxidoreductase subunit 6 (subunit J)
MPNELNQVSREIYENSNEFKQKQIMYIQEIKKQQVFVPVYWGVVLFLIVSAVYSGVTCWKRKNRVYKNWPDAAISMFLILPSFFALYMLFNLPEIPSIQTRINAVIIITVFLSATMGYHIWRVMKLNPGRNLLILMLIISGRILYSVMIPFLALAATSEGKRDKPQSYSGGAIELLVKGAVLYGLWAFTRRLMAKE